MKKFLLLSIFFLALNLSAQNTIVQGAWWFSVETPHFFPSHKDYYFLKIEGDTLIGNTSFAILKSQTNNGNFFNYAYLQEIDNRIYAYSIFNNQTSLIYDFNLSIGDLFFTNAIEEFQNNNVTITEINTIELRNGSLVNQFVFELDDYLFEPIYPYCTMVERLGTLFGIFGSFGSDCVTYTDANGHTLLGYGIGDSILYTPSQYSDIQDLQELIDYFPINTEKVKSTSLNLYPNPIIDYLLIENDLPNTQYHIIDINGKTILTTKKTTINLSNLANGIYYLVARTNKHVTTKKLVKM